MAATWCADDLVHSSGDRNYRDEMPSQAKCAGPAPHAHDNDSHGPETGNALQAADMIPVGHFETTRSVIEGLRPQNDTNVPWNTDDLWSSLLHDRTALHPRRSPRYASSLEMEKIAAGCMGNDPNSHTLAYSEVVQGTA